METEIVSAVQTVDFSLFALFWRATVVVKIVMIILIVASFWSWSIIFQKFINFRIARSYTNRFEASFWSGDPLDELYEKIKDKPKGSAERIFVAGMTEWGRSQRSDGVMIPGAPSRMERTMDVAIVREIEKLNNGLTFLATVGSIAPFIGLFGTVWGIKNAFEQIAISQSTNLAVVAPGIAEALVATALGLLAAIPAVVFYNKLSSDSERITARYDSFAGEFSTILSRQMEN
jgi:biopolymer transport protein TolQ